MGEPEPVVVLRTRPQRVITTMLAGRQLEDVDMLRGCGRLHGAGAVMGRESTGQDGCSLFDTAGQNSQTGGAPVKFQTPIVDRREKGALVHLLSSHPYC